MLQELLEKSLTQRIEDNHERTEEEMKADFNIHFEVNMFFNLPILGFPCHFSMSNQALTKSF